MPTARETGSTFTPAPSGAHLARCIGVISLGTQQPTTPTFHPTFKVLLIWELPNERVISDGAKAQTVSKEYSCSLSEKANLRKDLESWRGRPFTKEELGGFDVANVIDKPCMVSVIHKQSAKGSTYAAVNAVTSLPKGSQAPPRVNELVRFEIEDGQNDVFKALPEFIQNKIKASDEWMQPHAAVSQEPETEVEQESSDIPF